MVVRIQRAHHVFSVFQKHETILKKGTGSEEVWRGGLKTRGIFRAGEKPLMYQIDLKLIDHFVTISL